MFIWRLCHNEVFVCFNQLPLPPRKKIRDETVISKMFFCFFQNAMLLRKLGEMEDELRSKERDYRCQINESHQLSKRQKDDIRTLTVKLDSLEEEIAETKLKLSASEGRVTGLENEIVKIEG